MKFQIWTKDNDMENFIRNEFPDYKFLIDNFILQKLMEILDIYMKTKCYVIHI